MQATRLVAISTLKSLCLSGLGHRLMQTNASNVLVLVPCRLWKVSFNVVVSGVSKVVSVPQASVLD